MPAASPFIVRKAAVLGAGVMGAQIAAHLVNSNVSALLYELPAKEGDPNGNVLKAIDNLRKLEPSPLATPARAGFIQPANYAQHLEQLRDCDLVIEAIAERYEISLDTPWRDLSQEEQDRFLNGTGGERPPVEMEAAIPDPAREAATRERLLADAEKAFARFAEAKAFWDE